MNAPIPMNDLDRAILAFHADATLLQPVLDALLAGTEGHLYALIPYHPELINEERTLCQAYAQCVMSAENGHSAMFIFSSEERTREFCAFQKTPTRKFLVTRTASRELLGICARNGVYARINAGCSTGTMALPPALLAQLAARPPKQAS